MKNSNSQNTVNALQKRKIFLEGMHDGIPIGLGYFAVSFSLGIAAQSAGLSAFQSFLASLLCNASAGEYAGFTVIASNAAYIEMAIITLIVNARYCLMSFALSQRFSSQTSFIHRIAIGFTITDELFAINMARGGYINPVYTYGAVLTALPCWALGTLIGNIAGNILPELLVAAFGVTLFGMFLAIIIPPCKSNKKIALIIAVCFVLSYLSYLFLNISDGMKTIFLTVVISSLAAILFPINTKGENEQ